MPAGRSNDAASSRDGRGLGGTVGLVGHGGDLHQPAALPQATSGREVETPRPGHRDAVVGVAALLGLAQDRPC